MHGGKICGMKWKLHEGKKFMVWKDKIMCEKREILGKIWISEKVSGPKND